MDLQNIATIVQIFRSHVTNFYIGLSCFIAIASNLADHRLWRQGDDEQKGVDQPEDAPSPRPGDIVDLVGSVELAALIARPWARQESLTRRLWTSMDWEN
jgi:hypothetical protein